MSRHGGKLSSMFVPHEHEGIRFDEPSRTRQEFAEECDINRLMEKFEATGVISHVNTRQPMYLDLGDGVLPLQEALDTVRAANDAFMSLPARARAEFENDPVKFVEFCQKEENFPRLVEWGLAEVRDPDPAAKVVIANPEALRSPAPPEK